MVLLAMRIMRARAGVPHTVVVSLLWLVVRGKRFQYASLALDGNFVPAGDYDLDGVLGVVTVICCCRVAEIDRHIASN